MIGGQTKVYPDPGAATRSSGCGSGAWRTATAATG